MTFPQLWQRILDWGYFPRFFLIALAAAIVVLAFGRLLLRGFPRLYLAAAQSIRILGLTLILFLLCLILLFSGRGRFGNGPGAGVPGHRVIARSSKTPSVTPSEIVPRLLTEEEITRLRDAEKLSNPSDTAIIIRYERTGDDDTSPAFLAELVFTGEPVTIAGDRTEQFNRTLVDAVSGLPDAPGDRLRLYVINAGRAGSSQIDYLSSLFHERYPGIQIELH